MYVLDTLVNHWALQKWLNNSRYSSRFGLFEAKEPFITSRWGPRSPHRRGNLETYFGMFGLAHGWQGRRFYVFFWVWTHPLLRWIVYYPICIQHDIDKSQISFIELCFSKDCFVTAEFKISISPADWSLDPPTILHRSTPLTVYILNILNVIGKGQQRCCRLLPLLQQLVDVYGWCML